jgi:hypothetical protein
MLTALLAGVALSTETMGNRRKEKREKGSGKEETPI